MTTLEQQAMQLFPPLRDYPDSFCNSNFIQLGRREGWMQARQECAAEIEGLRAALKNCADDLEASVNAEYSGTLDYPSQQLKHERDMEPVRRARELLGDDQQLTAENAR